MVLHGAQVEIAEVPSFIGFLSIFCSCERGIGDPAIGPFERRDPLHLFLG
jgi:hypothetical protein